MDLHSSLLVGSLLKERNLPRPQHQILRPLPGWYREGKEKRDSVPRTSATRANQGRLTAGVTWLVHTPRARPLAELSASITRVSPGRRGCS